jgi:membrane-bound lytic murein transglycosylase C
VIETESFFNPAARSSAPAFGLMQLVPHYGAREAYRFVHKQDKIPTDAYLYNAKNNIELGSAYLHLLYFQHMNEIKNKESRLLCSIASYNTGPTNLYSAIIGKFSRSQFRKYEHWKDRALSEINKMSSDQLYQVLRQKLPFLETRSYIKKVRSRMDKYSSM